MGFYAFINAGASLVMYCARILKHKRLYYFVKFILRLGHRSIPLFPCAVVRITAEEKTPSPMIRPSLVQVIENLLG